MNEKLILLLASLAVAGCSSKMADSYVGIFTKMNGQEKEWSVPAYAYQRESGQFVIKYKTPEGDGASTPIMEEFGDECRFDLNVGVKLLCSNQSSDHRQNFSFVGEYRS
ncbi:hypothetical protein RGL59_004775 [Vibrio parahaemolyticus]|nr:hypothetical protein [Vibrio parahaemolyticus]MBE4187063.1 hypothetical protein [Vibrio parahaemolyticus]HAS6685756.1 hypothetical protein [Vibrio parahaemolyticus]HAS6696292.1 hypothetical protein [Vibrio parahaemolyticus]HBN6282619.1 hypothetical protein [Vibrio parahaemolyticus]